MYSGLALYFLVALLIDRMLEKYCDSRNYCNEDGWLTIKRVVLALGWLPILIYLILTASRYCGNRR